MELLIINGHDYSRFIKRKGLSWARNDLDSDKSTRTRDGSLRRVKIGTKRQLRFSVMGMTRAQLAQLDDDLSEPIFTARYLDLHGGQSRQFYCSSFSAQLNTAAWDAPGSWEGAEFTLTEV